MRVLALSVVMLTACGGSPEAPAFDVSAVQDSFEAECQDPIIVDEMFCDQVRLPTLDADGSTLIVTTTLNEAATDRAMAICEQFATARFDASGNLLGYDSITVQDRDGGTAATCST